MQAGQRIVSQPLYISRRTPTGRRTPGGQPLYANEAGNVLITSHVPTVREYQFTDWLGNRTLRYYLDWDDHPNQYNPNGRPVSPDDQVYVAQKLCFEGFKCMFPDYRRLRANRAHKVQLIIEKL